MRNPSNLPPGVTDYDIERVQGNGVITEQQCSVTGCSYHDSDATFYVTVVDQAAQGQRVGFLLGPYVNHQDAIDNVDRGRELANDADPRAAFYSFGTSSIKRERQTVFGS